MKVIFKTEVSHIVLDITKRHQLTNFIKDIWADVGQDITGDEVLEKRRALLSDLLNTTHHDRISKLGLFNELSPQIEFGRMFVSLKESPHNVEHYDRWPLDIECIIESKPYEELQISRNDNTTLYKDAQDNTKRFSLDKSRIKPPFSYYSYG